MIFNCLVKQIAEDKLPTRKFNRAILTIPNGYLNHQESLLKRTAEEVFKGGVETVCEATAAGFSDFGFLANLGK